MEKEARHVMIGLYWDNANKNGNYYLGVNF